MRSLLLGKKYIPSHTQYKRVLLTSQLCLVAFSISTLYLVFDLTNGIEAAWPFQLTCAILSAVSFALNRFGHYTSAKMLFGVSINLIVFIFSLLQPVQIGLYTFFIVCMIGALAVFGYEERGRAIFFLLLSLTLFLLPFLVDFDFIPHQEYTDQYIQINVIANFFTASIASAMIIYFLINVNHHSEAALRENERQINEKNEDLTKLNTELDRFVYSTSHDLRAPLSSIQGLIQLTKMTNDPKEVRQYIDIMEGRLKSLMKFIGDISDYSRNNRMEISTEPISVSKMVVEILESLKFYPNSQKIKTQLDIPEGCEIITDPIRLHIILSNLISNSFKYMDQGKEEPFIQVSAKVIDSVVHIKIEDNGVGINENYLEKIFEMFFQAHEKSEGSGLGLYIVKEAIQKLDGKILVSSEEGNGSRFEVELPVSIG